MVTTELLSLFAGSASLFSLALGHVAYRKFRPYREYKPEPFIPLKASRFEFVVEKNGKFVATGELVPPEVDPHTCVMERSVREGISYGAREISG